MRGIGLVVVAWALVVLAGCGVIKPADFTIPSLVANGPIQVGEYALVTVPAGLPDAPVASKTTVTFQLPPVPGTSTALIGVPVTSVDAIAGGTYVLHIVVPNLAITKTTSYQLTVTGSTSKNTFASKTAMLANVLPGATLASIAPTSGTVGQTLDVTLTGAGTKFVQGTTQASFGPGISVNGAAAGASGLIQVTNAATGVAHLVIGSGATPGTRDVVVATTPEQVTLVGAFTVKAVVLPPVANAGGPYTGTSGTAVSFSAAGSSDPGGSGLSYAWTFGDGGTATGVAPTYTYAASGNFAVAVTVTNTAGGSAVGSTTALIAAPAKPPVANAGGPYSGTTGAVIAFSAAGSSDPQNSPLTYAWNFGDGTTGTGIAPTHTYASANVYAIGLTVSNGVGLSSTASTQAVVTAAKLPPVSKVGGPYAGKIGTAVVLDGSGSSDPKSETLTYAWSFGDGSVGVGVSPSHTYAGAGTYTVSLTVMNTDALSSTPSATTAVITANAPVGKAGGPYSGVAGTAVTLDGSGSTDLNGLQLTYLWGFGDGSTGSGVAPSHTYATAGTYTVTLTVNDSQAAGTPVTTSAVISAAAVAPVGRVGGPYSGVAGTVVTFDGSASTDGNGLSLTYVWNFGDGSTGSGATPSHTYAAAGTFTVTLTVSDSKLPGTPVTASAVIVAAAVAPVGNPGGPYTGLAGTAVTFNGSSSTDGNGLALTYVWDFGDGATGSGVAPTHTYAAAGTFAVKLTVSDSKLAGSPVTTSAVISAAPVAPVGNAGGPYAGVASTAVSFSGSGSTDGSGLVLTYLWNFGDGATGSGVAPTHTYAAAGTFTVTLTVSDSKLAGSPVTTSAVISAAPVAPVGNAGGPYAGVASTAVSFSGSGSTDGSGLVLTYLWNFGDGATGTGVAPTHTYAAAGTYTVTLTVSDSKLSGAPVTTSAVITAAAVAPIGNASGPYTGTAGAAVTFSGAGSTDGNGLALTYLWNFGDGSTGSGVAPTHTYAASGTYTVTLTVSDSKLTGTPVTTLAVIAAVTAQPPVANPGGPYSGTAGTAGTFSGAGSTDPGGLALTYMWSFGDGGTGAGVAPTHTYLAAGTYTVSLTVKDSVASSTTVTTSAVIAAVAVQAPVAHAGGPYTGGSSFPVIFNSAGSFDPANASAGALALSFAWSFGDGGTSAGPSPVHTYTTGGTYTVVLTVTKSGGATATATTTATISNDTPTAGTPKSVPGGPYSGTVGTAVNFSGLGSSDPNSVVLTYAWDFGDGNSGSGASLTHTYTAAGTYSVVLTVNNGAAFNTVSTVATIAPAAPLPAMLANAGGPYTIAVNQPLTLDGSKTTNPASRQLSYTWDFGDGSTGTGRLTNHTYTVSASYSVVLSATDGLTGYSSSTTQVTVTGPAAEAISASAGGPYAGLTGASISFDATSSTDNLGNSLAYAWAFGDGGTGTGATPTHTYAAKGSYTATVTASSNGVSKAASATVAVTTPIQVTLTSPLANALFGTNTVTVTGTVSVPNLTVTVNGTAAQVSGNSFTATGVTLREGVNLLTATATDGSGAVGTAIVSVILDATAPTASIVTPANGSTVTSSALTVAGLVNDSVTGTVGSDQVTVTVNGLPAQVSNRSFMLSNLTLVPGINTITVVTTDMAGNSSQTTGKVNLASVAAQQTLVMLSGNGQTGAVTSFLAQPLVVQLQTSGGAPIANRPVTFTVTRSDGQVEVAPTIAQSLYVNTDSAGKATVLFKLGSRSGLGINQVSATTPGAVGAVVFSATTTAGAATQMHAVRGENQRGILGTPLASGLQVIAADTYGNPVPGVAVTYSVTSGDGTLDGKTTTENVTTDASGKAIAQLTLGQQEGNNNYAVSATFPGDTVSPILFQASGYAEGAVVNTRVSGIVLDNANTPIPNATVKLLGTQLVTTSDVNGRFLFNGAPVGTVTMTVDGSTSTRTETFPFLSFVLQSLPGQNNALTHPIYLPAIDITGGQTVGGDDPVTLTMANVPGVAFTVAPHSVTFPDGSKVGKLTLSQVKSDMVPMEPVNGAGPSLIWTLQPAGARFSIPIQVTMPNLEGLAPGQVTEIYQFDHDLEQFVSAGTAHVSADGSVVISDPGFGITKAGWGHTAPPPPNNGCISTCVSTECITQAPLRTPPGACGCSIKANDGAKCGAQRVGPNSCQLPGKCIGTTCSGKRLDNNATCDDGQFCTENDTCKTGVCAGTKIEPSIVGGTNGWGLQIEQNLTAGLTPLIRVFGKPSGYQMPIEIRPFVHFVANDKLVCCEAKQLKNVDVDQVGGEAGVNIDGPKFGIPSLSYAIPAIGGIYVYIQLGGGVTGSLLLNDDWCADKHCVTGGIKGEITVAGGIEAYIGNSSANAYIKGGVFAQLVVTCDNSVFSFGLSDVNVVGELVLTDGRKFSANHPLISAQDMGSIDIILNPAH